MPFFYSISKVSPWESSLLCSLESLTGKAKEKKISILMYVLAVLFYIEIYIPVKYNGNRDLNDKGPEFPVPLKGGKGMDRKYMEIPVVKQIAEAEEVGWVNPKWRPWNEGKRIALAFRWRILMTQRRDFTLCPFIMKCFPETAERNGLIESALDTDTEDAGISEPDVWRSDSGTSPTSRTATWQWLALKAREGYTKC